MTFQKVAFGPFYMLQILSWNYYIAFADCVLLICHFRLADANSNCIFDFASANLAAISKQHASFNFIRYFFELEIAVACYILLFQQILCLKKQVQYANSIAIWNSILHSLNLQMQNQIRNLKFASANLKWHLSNTQSANAT